MKKREKLNYGLIAFFLILVFLGGVSSYGRLIDPDSTCSILGSCSEVVYLNYGNVGNVSADWFNGKFNWTSGDNYNSFDGSTLLFNQSKLEVTYYNASTVQVIVGTLDGGDVDSIKTYDEVSLNVSEDNADPGLDIRFNFTNVDDFNQVIIRFKTDSGSDHKTSIQLWDFVNNVWEDHDYYIETTIWDNPYMPIWDSSLHVGTGTNEGDVWVRILLDDMGKLAHTHYYDFIQLSKGFGTYSSTENDPLSYHKDEDIILDDSSLEIRDSDDNISMYFENGYLVVEG